MARPDRRSATDRRARALLSQPFERALQRRRGERRESPRVRRSLWVREVGSDVPPSEVRGNIGLGGASWTAPAIPVSGRVEVRFRISEALEPLTVQAQVVHTQKKADQVEIHVAFETMPVKAELALARFVENRARLRAASSDEMHGAR